MALRLCGSGIIGFGLIAELWELAMFLLTHVGICSFNDTITH